MNLVPAIQEMENAIGRLKHEYEIQIKELQNGLKALRQLNTVCEKCDGKGTILRSRACAEDDRPDPNDPTDWRKCSECHGSGKANKIGLIN